MFNSFSTFSFCFRRRINLISINNEKHFQLISIHLHSHFLLMKQTFPLIKYLHNIVDVDQHHDEVFQRKSKEFENERNSSYKRDIKYLNCSFKIKGISGCQPFLIIDINERIVSDDKGGQP